ncbi:MAG: hypothetical protein ABL952_15145 [Pyrinomonadaceae bacterium]
MPNIKTATPRRNKHFILDQVQLTKAKNILGAKTETETIDRALEIVISETTKNRVAWEAHNDFIQAGMRDGLVLEDVFGHLDKE